MACRIQQLYQDSLMSTLGPKSTSWVVARQRSVWGWRAAKLGLLGKPLQGLCVPPWSWKYKVSICPGTVSGCHVLTTEEMGAGA